MTRHFIAAPFVAAALLSATPAVHAQTDAPRVVVRYDDLRMGDPAAAKVLQHRIERAAADVCGGRPDIRDLDRQPAFESCRDEATDRAVSQLRMAGVLAPSRAAGITALARR